MTPPPTATRSTSRGETFTLPDYNANGKLGWTGKGLTIDGGYAADGGTPGARTNTATVLQNTTAASASAKRILYASSVTNGTLRNVKLRGGTVYNAYGANVYMTGCTNMLLDTVTIENGSQQQYHSGFAAGGGVYALNSWGSISNSIIQGNTIYGQWGQYYGQGIYLAGGGWSFRDSIIRNNRDTSTAGSSTYRGMGLYIQSGTHQVRNCVIARNFTENFTSGSAVYVEGGSLTMQNATVFWHPQSGIQRQAGTVTIRDSIIWNNGDDLVGTGFTLQNNCIEDGDSNGSNGNFSADPRFERGFYLAANSPCVNTGSTTVAAAGLTGYTTRADGTADADTVDIGYHFPPGSAVVDYYVDAGTGADSNTGLAPGSAFKTIKKALSMVGDGSRVFVADGLYNTANGETFPLGVANKFGIQILGAGRDTTIVDATSANLRCLNITYVYPGAAISGLTLKRGQPTGSPGGGLYASSVHGVVASCGITDNVLPNPGNWGSPTGGGAALYFSSLVFSNCFIARNTVTPWYPESSYGGGIYAAGGADGSLQILNSTIVSNTANASGDSSWATHAYGGGLYIISGNTTVRNSLIAHNDARTTSFSTPHGDAAHVAGGTVLFENCTIATNHPVAHARRGDAYTGGLGIERAGGTLTGNNSILWGNGTDALCTMTANWSNVGTTNGLVTLNNCISLNPQFINVAGGDYRLQVKGGLSSSVNAGNPAAADWMLTGVDLDGNPRIQNKRVDQGAYETFIPPRGTLITIQ